MQHHLRPRHLAGTAVLTALLSAFPLAAEDWPRWMGPHGDGSVESDAFDGSVTLSELWRQPIGEGYAAVSVAGGRAFTMGYDGSFDHLVAFEAASGAELWRVALDQVVDDSSHLGPLSTPTIEDGRVFALSERGWLHAVSTAGELLWTRNLRQSFQAVPPSYGISTSPLVAGGRLLVLVGGHEGHNLVAFDPASGEVLWSVFHAEMGSYASPIPATLGGVRQVVVPAGDRLYGVDGDGTLLWRHGGVLHPDRSPVVLPGDRIFLALADAGVMIGLKGRGTGLVAEELWRNSRFGNSYSPAVHHEGALFGFSGMSLTCLDAATGEALWRERKSGSLIRVGSHLVILEQGGRLVLARASRDGYEEKLAVPALSGSFDGSPPSFAGGRVFVRNGEEVAAFAVTGDAEVRE